MKARATVRHTRENNGSPARFRKSHSKSQRRPASGDTQLRQATVEAGQVLSEPSPATSSDAREVTGGQGVAGSNPAVPTGSEIFSNTLLPHQSQQRAILLCNGPLEACADRMPLRRLLEKRNPIVGLPGTTSHRS